MKTLDLTGQKFGKLTAIKIAGQDKNGHVMWLCECECGKTKSIRQFSLRTRTKSCGCLINSNKEYSGTSNQNYKHGNATSTSGHSRTYVSWLSMRQRCYNPKSISFKNYGGRGITVCDEWKDDFEKFLADLGERPLNTSLDRIDNDGNYYKKNCRWATRKEQSMNRRKRIKQC